MAADIKLFEQAEAGNIAARVYSWDGPCVSLGMFQRAERVLLSDAIPWVQRPTGGKAVLHGHDVTLGMAVPLNVLGLDGQATRSVGRVYRRLVPLIVRALNDAGVKARLGEETAFVNQKRLTADCFAHVAPNDIVNPDTGQKVCGCALRLGQRSVLVQASIPVGRPLVDVRSVFANPQAVAWSLLDADLFAGHLEAVLGRAVTGQAAIP